MIWQRALRGEGFRVFEEPWVAVAGLRWGFSKHSPSKRETPGLRLCISAGYNEVDVSFLSTKKWRSS
jgi:hypothetical protein